MIIVKPENNFNQKVNLMNPEIIIYKVAINENIKINPNEKNKLINKAFFGVLVWLAKYSIKVGSVTTLHGVKKDIMPPKIAKTKRNTSIIF